MADIKKQLQWSKLKVGSVITLALLILLVTVFFAGSLEDFFSKKVELKTHFKDVKGLRKGAPVWVFGTEVGSVKAIDLDPAFGTIVTMKINKSALPFIREDSTASILTMGLLGDKYIEIGAGSPEAKAVRPGETIQGTLQIEFQDVMKTSSATIETMSEFIKKLDGFVTKIEEGQGTVAKLLNDPSLYNNLNETTRTLSKTSQTLSLVAEEIRTSQGTLNKLIEDPSLYEKLQASASHLEEMTRTVKESTGTLKKLIEDPTLYNQLLASSSHIEASSKKIEEFSGKLNPFITKLDAFSTRLSEGQGTLRKLIEDPALYEDLDKGVRQLSSVMEDAHTILERIDKGEGLATAFLKNKELVKELDETLVQFKTMTREMEALLKDIKANPKKYLKFSLF